ncbi:MAG: murein DD-endopeptidase MepM/ murein hydrolase activator NlpD [Parasphingorhabdus sp.]|jgi:murein DD-endopeptidase MepM/ murein hydrolase activator NlpD
MRRGLFHFVCIFILAVNFVSATYAFENFQSIPGGIAGVLLDEDSGPAIKALYGHTRIPVISHQSRRVALVPLNWDTQPGFYIVSTLNDNNDYKSYTFSVKPGDRTLYSVSLADTDLPFLSQPTIDPNIDLSEVDGEISNPDLSLMLPVDAPVLRQYGQLYIKQHKRVVPYTGIQFEVITPDINIVSPVFGRVAEIKHLEDGTWQVILDHGNGLVSIFNGLSTITVNMDDWLPKGSDVGLLSIGRKFSLQPHWSLRMNGAWIDPMLLVSSEINLPQMEISQSKIDDVDENN